MSINDAQIVLEDFLKELKILSTRQLEFEALTMIHDLLKKSDELVKRELVKRS